MAHRCAGIGTSTGRGGWQQSPPLAMALPAEWWWGGVRPPPDGSPPCRDGKKGSFVLFGGIDPSYTTNGITWIPLSAETYWQISMDR